MRGRIILPLLFATWLVIIPNLKAQANQQVVVFAAASLTNAFEAIATEFEANNPTVEILYNFGGSSTLATQINQGAPADVYASANIDQMQRAVADGRIIGTPQTFATNRLVIIVPIDNPASIQSIDDLAKSGIFLVLAAPDVPIRQYTDSLFESLVADPAYGESYRSAVLANLVSEEPNVRQVAAKIAFGEADAGIVYASDVTEDIREDVLAIPIPDEINPIASYPIAIVEDAPNPGLAQAFIDFILSADGQGILSEWGFSLLESADSQKPCILLCRFMDKQTSP